MNYILFDDNLLRAQLMPFTFTRPIADIRIGIDTIREKWESYLGAKVSVLTEEYLSEKFPLISQKDNILINASLIPNEELIEVVKNLKANTVLSFEDSILAYRVGGDGIEISEDMYEEEYEGVFEMVEKIWDIFLLNGEQIRKDFSRLIRGNKTESLNISNKVLGGENIFVGKNTKISNAILNAEKGPIYIGDNVEIMDGAMLRGPLAICDNSIIKMGAKIYGDTTIGVHCKIGGEVSNTVIFGYSNKGHDGFLGNSVVGEWCNLGADTNNSNLKNDYSEVKIWSYAQDTFISTGEMFCGLFMGDHSKAAINTMFNTGTVVGIGANIFGSGFPRQFIASFTWGGTKTYDIKKAIDTAKRVYARRDMELTQVDIDILEIIYNTTHQNRGKK